MLYWIGLKDGGKIETKNNIEAIKEKARECAKDIFQENLGGEEFAVHSLTYLVGTYGEKAVLAALERARTADFVSVAFLEDAAAKHAAEKKGESTTSYKRFMPAKDYGDPKKKDIILKAVRDYGRRKITCAKMQEIILGATDHSAFPPDLLARAKRRIAEGPMELTEGEEKFRGNTGVERVDLPF